MKKILIFIFILGVFMAINLYAETKIIFPDDWKTLEDSSFFQHWRKEDKKLYLQCEGDFNGDGHLDFAYILENKNQIGISIYVFLYDPQGFSQHKLFDTTTDPNLIDGFKEYPNFDSYIKGYFLYYGIKTLPPGKYLTACGKGLVDCGEEGSEMEEIVIANESIVFFHYDADGDKAYFWDIKNKKFKYVWLN